MADGTQAFLKPKLKRTDFMDFIQIHCLPEVEDEEKSRTELIRMIAHLAMLRERPSSVIFESLNRKNLCRYLSEMVSSKFFEFDYDPKSLPDSDVLSNKTGWHFYLGRSGTARQIFAYPVIPTEHKVRARDEGIHKPAFLESYETLGIYNMDYVEHYKSTRMEYGREYHAGNLHLIEFWDYIHIMAFKTLPIRYTLAEIRTMFPIPDEIHPECPEYARNGLEALL
jgi:hypothetical protein